MMLQFRFHNAVCLALLVPLLLGPEEGVARVSDGSRIVKGWGNSWTLRNDVVELGVSFHDGSVALTCFRNLEAGVDYVAGQNLAPLFVHQLEASEEGAAPALSNVEGSMVPLSRHGGNGVPPSREVKRFRANDGGWSLQGVRSDEIVLYGRNWGKRLELTLTRSDGGALSVRQVFEVYNGRAAIRCLSFVGNGTDKQVTISASEVLNLNVPDRAHSLHYVEGISRWKTSPDKLARGGRNCIIRYAGGHGLFIVPENNWATCLVPGGAKGVASEKLLYVDAFSKTNATLTVTANPRAVQLTLFPREEVEYFAVNFGVFKGDVLDGRIAVAEHMRKRFKFVGPTHELAANDWQWGFGGHGRTDKNYREHVIPKAAAGGFDRVNIDDFWYAPEDGTDPRGAWTDMPSLCADIVKNGMKPGHWFSLQGKWCVNGWGNGRDAADPANIDFKLKQMRDILIGKYQSRWDQVDAGLLWKTDAVTSYSHPMDSVYRKILGTKRYMNAITHEYPDFLMQVTCEIDNPSGAGGAASRGNQNVGLIHLADNGIVGMFRRTDAGDDVRDLFDCYGLFPLEGLLSTWGEDRIQPSSWQDSPLWYYQFLLARHTMIYSRPWEWSPESIAHLRAFNDWRKTPRIAAVLDQLMVPVYNGVDWEKNEGPWCWSFCSPDKRQMLVLAINHLDLAAGNAFMAKLRTLDPEKTYRVNDVTMLPGGRFNNVFKGVFPGAVLREKGLPIDLDDGVEPCAAFWIEETSVTVGQGSEWLGGTPRPTAIQAVRISTATFLARDSGTAGTWNGKYGERAAWIAGTKIESANGFSLRLRNAETFVWGDAEGQNAVLNVPVGQSGPDGRPVPKKAACWTAGQSFSMAVKAIGPMPYKLSVYVMDYDIRKPEWARDMDLIVKTRDGKVLDTQSATHRETATGVYLSWVVTGPVTVEARRTKGINAAVSGVFVDDVMR